MSKQAGRMSQSANDFLEPKAPVSVSATNVPSGRPYNDGRVDVAFSLPGDSPAATSYTVTASTGQTATGASSPISVTGIASNATPTFTVTASNASGTSPASVASSAVTVTTVPQTPSAPSASSPSAGTDSVSWSAPNNGGSAITNYHWESNDSKSGDTGTGTSVSVGQEQGTAQAYRVYATNANGNSGYSEYSGTVTTTFSFTPFGFTPFGFTPFGFTPFSFTPFGGVFGFSPFGGVFGFSPFGVFAFNPPSFSFAPAPSGFFFHWSLNVNTEVMLSNVAGQPNTTKPAGELAVGDKLLALDLGSGVSDWTTWQSSTIDVSQAPVVETTITSIDIVPENQFVYVDGDLFSKSHYILTRKNGIVKFIKSVDIDTTYERYSHAESSFVPINLVEVVDLVMNKVSINCEPYDNFFTKQMLVFDRPDAN